MDLWLTEFGRNGIVVKFFYGRHEVVWIVVLLCESATVLNDMSAVSPYSGWLRYELRRRGSIGKRPGLDMSCSSGTPEVLTVSR